MPFASHAPDRCGTGHHLEVPQRRRWTSYAGVAILILVEVLFALIAVAATDSSPWLVLPLAAAGAAALVWIAKWSPSGAVAVGAVVAFLLFMFACAAATGVLSGI